MKFIRFLVLIILTFFFSNINAQIVLDTTKIKPEDIPSPETMKAMGVPDELIQKIMDFKLHNLNNLPVVKQDTSKRYNLNKFQSNKGKPDTSRVSRIIDSTLLPVKYPSGRIFGQDLFRNKNLKIFNKATQTNAPDGYILGIGDELSISVWGFAEYNDAFKISEEGYITPKYIGRVYVKGLRFGDAKSLLIKKFSQVTDMKNSRIDITLNYSRVINVNVVGEVYNPGSYSIPALNTVFNALIAASGPTQIGSVRSIYLKRNNKIVDSLDVYKFLNDPNNKNDIYLENNDYIVVAVAKRIASISGEVNRPFMYELKGTETINSLIKYAGGILPSAYTINLQVRRYTDNKIHLLNINLDSLKKNNSDFIINDGDQVFVDRISKELTNIVTATGAVKIPGSYEFKEGERVEDLLKKVQGLTYDALTSVAYIVRQKKDLNKKYLAFSLQNVMSDKNSPDNILLEKFDTLRVLSQFNFTDVLKVSVFGAVRKPGDYDYGENFTLKDVILMSGGLKQESANNRIEISRIIDYDKTSNKVIPIRAIVSTIQIGNDLSISEEAKKFILQPYDHIYIRTNPDFETPKKVFINGEVMYPGVYSLTRKDETVAEVIQRAGGLTKFAYIPGVTMSRKFEETGLVYLNLDKALKRVHSKYNIVLNDSDIVNVPKTVDLVHIAGAIGNANFKSISAPYFSKKRARFYIRNFAGGFNKDCRKGGTNVIYPNGILKRTKSILFVRFYPRVRNGSNIQLPYKDIKETDNSKKVPVDWNKTIENVTVKATGLLTLWLLITKLK